MSMVEYNKEPALSANNSSKTSSLDTCSFLLIILIKNRKKSFPGECPKVLILHKLQACSPTVLAATAHKICAQNRANSRVFYIVSKLKGIFEKAKNHFRQTLVTCTPHTYFSLCGCPTFLCRRLKISHKIP